jgi:hypothetical protein
VAHLVDFTIRPPPNRSSLPAYKNRLNLAFSRSPSTSTFSPLLSRFKPSTFSTRASLLTLHSSLLALLRHSFRPPSTHLSTHPHRTNQPQPSLAQPQPQHLSFFNMRFTTAVLFTAALSTLSVSAAPIPTPWYALLPLASPFLLSKRKADLLPCRLSSTPSSSAHSSSSSSSSSSSASQGRRLCLLWYRRIRQRRLDLDLSLLLLLQRRSLCSQPWLEERWRRRQRRFVSYPSSCSSFPFPLRFTASRPN